MFSTIVLVGALLLLLTLQIVLSAMFLRWGLRWAGYPGATLRRATIVVVVNGIINAALLPVFNRLADRPGTPLLALAIVAIVIGIAMPCVLISRAFGTTTARALRAFLVMLIPTIGLVGFTKFVYIPYVFEAFKAEANSMAPTIIGRHVLAVCPECRAPNTASFDDRPGKLPEPRRMICSRFHSHEIKQFDDKELPPDRFITAKFLSPRRWDLIVFRNPDDDSQNYVKRLIGLPGETVHIADGSVFVNGKQLDLPEELTGLRYVTEFPDYPTPEPVWGSVEKPAVLGDGEYFVLGDNSQQSLDSRLWQHGAPGHPSYAVPKSHFIGVVTHIYWPPERMRIIR